MDGAEVEETHVSVLVFLGDQVLKFRKPLHLDFVDFSSREARAADCRRELPKSCAFGGLDSPQTAALFVPRQRRAAARSLPNRGGFWGSQHEMPFLHLSDRPPFHPAGRRLGAGPFDTALRLEVRCR